MIEIIIDFIALALLYFFVFYKRWSKIGRDKLFVNTMMYVYISFVLYFTVMPIIVSLPFIFNHPYEPINLIPFIDVIGGRGDFLRQVVLNVIMMIPFGFLLPITDQKYSFGKTILYAFIFSLCIELLQPLINGIRSADITDLITNTLGCMIGYGLYVIFKPIITRVLLSMK